MDLRDRGGCERLGVKPHDRIAEVLAHDSLDLGERKGRHGVHELGELLDVDVGQQVGTRGEQLAELQERRPELLEGSAELDGALARGRSAAGDPELAHHADELPPTRDAHHFAGAPRAV